jgi:hypothetical protein
MNRPATARASTVVGLATAGLLVSVAAAGCQTTDTSTQLTVVLTSEAAIPTQVNQLVVTVSSQNSTKGPYTTDLTRDDNGFFPQTVALIPQDEASVSQPVTVTVSAQYVDGSGVAQDVDLRTAVASYVEGHTLLLPMPLRMACFQTTCDGAGESCVGGQCVQANVSSLVDYQKQYVFHEPGSCFDSATCLASPVQLPTPGDDCTFALPAGAATSGGVPAANVSVEWDAAPGLVIVLDGDDKDEGWTPLPGDPTKGLLSLGICHAIQRQAATKSKAKGFYVSTGCPAKSHLQPACDPTTNIGVPLP